MNHSLFSSFPSDPRKIVLFCKIGLFLGVLSVYFLSIPIVAALIFSLALLSVSVIFVSRPLADLTQTQHEVLKGLRMLEFALGCLCGMSVMFVLIVYSFLPELAVVFKAWGVS